MNYIIHNCTREFVYPTKRNNLQIKVTVTKSDKCNYYIVYWNNLRNNIPKREMKMECYARSKDYDYYFCNVVLNEVVNYLRYYIVSDDGSERCYLNTYGIQNAEPKEGFFEYHYANENDIFQIPEWTKNAVIYQIFPERFCNGDKANDPKGVEEWGGVPTRENYFGGDIKGITQKLDYLSELGIDAIYFTPIFEGASNHKYDTIDYLKIDKSFGTIDEFKQLVTKAHELNIRIILDGVFNHCGYYFEPFQDIIKNQADSKSKDWFYVSEFPIETEPLNYECVGYYKWMPKLRHKTKEVRDYILQVGEYWIKEAGIDGWRLDVSDEVDYTLLHEFRKMVKDINPDLAIIGETWTDGRDLLRGDQMDSIMNYLFRDALLGFVAKGDIDAKEFDSRIGKMLSIYNRTAYDSLYNMLGSHDTDRFLTMCNGSIDKMKLAIVFQMAFPGMPAVYYGDEVGMTGQNDPDCRKTMEWENQNNEIKNHYKTMINMRKENIALQKGEYKPVVCDGQVYSFARIYGDESVYVVINNCSENKIIKLPVFKSGKYVSLLSNVAYELNEVGNKHFYNDDIHKFNGYLELELNDFGFEIIKTMKE